MKTRHIVSFILCAAMLFSLCACGDTQAAESNTQSVEANTQSVEANTQSVEANTQSVEANTQSVEANTQSAEAKTQSISKEADYLRAFEMGYVDEKYKSMDIDEQLSSLEYRSMLIDMMTAFECEDIPWFESKVTDADMPLSRGAAIIMSYYSAVCMGADNYNNKMVLPNTRKHHF